MSDPTRMTDAERDRIHAWMTDINAQEPFDSGDAVVIYAELLAVEKERDAALAEVERLTKKVRA